MKRLLAYLIFALLALPNFALPPDCSPLPTVIINDYIIEGRATNGEGLLRSAQVSLYSQGKLVRRVVTDWEAQFTLDHLSRGDYRLSIQGLGSFNVRVVVTAVEPPQQLRHYGFSKRNGCLTWGFSTN
jgi:hypothetical protein